MGCVRVVSGGVGIWLAAGAAAIGGPDGQELLYVGNNRGGTISVIEVPAFKVVGEFDALPDIARSRRAPGSYVDDFVAPSSGEVLYVSRGDARDIAAFSTDRERLLWRVPTQGVADHFALSPDGRRLFVSVENEGRALVIDTAKREVVGQFENGPGPHGMRLSPDGSRVYNGCITGNQLTVADAMTFQIPRTMAWP